MDDTMVIRDETGLPGTSMAEVTTHAKPERSWPSSQVVAAWFVLAGAGLTMASFNIWHALHSGMPGYLAFLVGIAPVLIAGGLSHIVATRQGRFLKLVTFVVMVGAMVLSVRATGYVVRLAFGNLWPLFGAVVDSAALVALQAILTRKSRAEERAEQQAAEQAAARELAAARADADAQRIAREAADAVLATARDELARVTAKMRDLEQALEAERGKKPARKPAAPPRRPATPRQDETIDLAAEVRILEALGSGQLNTEAAILQLVEAGHKPSQAGVLAGKSDSYGRKVARKAEELTKAAPKGQDPETP